MQQYPLGDIYRVRITWVEIVNSSFEYHDKTRRQEIVHTITAREAGVSPHHRGQILEIKKISPEHGTTFFFLIFLYNFLPILSWVKLYRGAWGFWGKITAMTDANCHDTRLFRRVSNDDNNLTIKRPWYNTTRRLSCEAGISSFFSWNPTNIMVLKYRTKDLIT